MKHTLLIRADANAEIGTGHVMRCMALAQAWQSAGGTAVFASAGLTAALGERLRREGFETVPVVADAGTSKDAEQTIAFARANAAGWIVADGYALGDAWQGQIKAAGLNLFVCDDHRHARHSSADIIWNQNPAFTAGDYAGTGAETKFLLGARFAMLRSEFSSWQAWRRETPAVARKVLVTLGGGDPDNVTLKAIEALRMIDATEALVVVGASNPHLETLKAAVAGVSHLRLVVNATNMPELMAWADVAITAGGSTCWELAFMGLPAVVAVLADNQARIAAELERRGICISMGDHRELNCETIAKALGDLLNDVVCRTEMSRRGRVLIDGHGAASVAAALGAKLKISFVSDADSWLNAFLPELKAEFERDGHSVRWVHDPAEVEVGDMAFLLSLSRIVPAEVRARNAHNLVVHESALPRGRGWSPLTWQVLEGKSEIPISLIEAEEAVDSGVIYAQETIPLRGDELVGELRAAQAAVTLRLCRWFVTEYPFSGDGGREQQGEPSYYGRRRPEDSRLDPNKSLREQFNLLRVADPDRYPAFFEIAGRRYEVCVRAAPRPAVRACLPAEINR